MNSAILGTAYNIFNEMVYAVYLLLTTELSSFNSNMYSISETIMNAITGLGYGIMIILFFLGWIKSAGTMAETKRPEVIFKQLMRLIITNALVIKGFTLIYLPFLEISQGIVKLMFTSINVDISSLITVPTFTDSIEDELLAMLIDVLQISLASATAGMSDILGILVGIVVLILFIVGSFTILLTVYGRFFKMYMYAAVLPIGMAFFASESTAMYAKNYLKNLASVFLEGGIIALSLILFCAFVNSDIAPDLITTIFGTLNTVDAICNVFYLFILLGIVKSADMMTNKLFGFQ